MDDDTGKLVGYPVINPPSPNYTTMVYPDQDATQIVKSDWEEMEWSCIQFEFWTCAVVIGGMCVLGITGNITSYCVLWKHTTETATVYLLQILAVSDSFLLLTSLVVYVFSTVFPYTGKLQVLYDSCNVVQTYIWPLSLMAHTTTIWITVLVTLNRYYAICHLIGPFRAYVLQATKLQVIAVVSFSVLYNTPRFFEHQVIRKEVTYVSSINGFNTTNVTYEEMNLGDSKVYQIVYSNIIYFPVMYIVPLITLTILNSKLIRALNAIKIRKEALTGHRSKDDHITVVIIVIVFVFIVCQTPALINQIFWAMTTRYDRGCGQFHFYYTKISDALVVLNSSTNFVIYCLFGKTFRRVFIDTICRKNIYRQRYDDTCSQPLREL